MYATKQGKKEIVEILLANGGEPLGKSSGKVKARMNSLEISEVRRYTDIMKLFFQHIQASRPVDDYEPEQVIQNEANIANDVQVELVGTNQNYIKDEPEKINEEKIVPKVEAEKIIEENVVPKVEEIENQKIKKEEHSPQIKSLFARIGGFFGL
jgi:hypothetical protein